MSLKGAEYVHSPEKRGLDVVGSLTMLTLGSVPVLVPIGVATSLQHRVANPFFVQSRLGKAGTEFDAYKFESLLEHDSEEVLGGADHPNASRFGRFARNSALDELPQLVNVLRGDMSLVGIRPLTSRHMAAYREMIDDEDLYEEWRDCYDQNPGLTGEGQLYSKRFADHDVEVIRRRMEIDIESFNNASLANDFRVLLRTPGVLLSSMTASQNGGA